MKNVLSILIVFLIPAAANSQIFENSKIWHITAGTRTSNIELCTLDFDGDGKQDIFCRELSGSNEELIFMHQHSYIWNRSIVQPIDSVVNDDRSSYAVYPPFTPNENRDMLLFCSPEGQMKAIRYIADNDISTFDRYKLFSYNLSLSSNDLLGENFRVNSIFCGNLSRNGHVNLIAVTDNNSVNKIVIYENLYQSTLKNEERIVTPTYIYSLPEIRNLSYVNSFDNDNVSGLFFEFERSWHVWLAHASNNVGFGFDMDSNRAFSVSIPSGAIKAIDITESSGDYPLFVGVETEADSDIAFVAFPLDDFNHPITVSIPNKHLLGNNSRLFTFHNANTGEESLFCIVYSRLDENAPQSNSFSIFKIDPDDPAQPELIQTFTPDALNGRYFDRPMLMDDFNSDGISDLIITWADPSSQKYGFSGFAGLGETRIYNWSVYE